MGRTPGSPPPPPRPLGRRHGARGDDLLDDLDLERETRMFLLGVGQRVRPASPRVHRAASPCSSQRKLIG